MNIRPGLFLLIVLAGSCTSPAGRNVPAANHPAADSTKELTGKNCFLHLDGNSRQDSTQLSLTFNGGQVWGELNWIPKEKDARRGSVTATRTGDLVKGTWIYMQEGVKDTLAVEFKISGSQLLQKSVHIDQATGREYLDEASPFDIVFLKSGCKN